jgi:hypothetical protein
MEGPLDSRGIIPRSVEEIFHYISESADDNCHFLVRASFLQLYNEVISDLLQPSRSNLSIREDKKRGVFVENLSETVVRSPAEVYSLLNRGSALRATANTKLNETSSRSHAIFQLIIEQSRVDLATKNKTFKFGKLNLVDLAGSERVRISGAKGSRLEESKYINQSLSALGNVISALIDKRNHVPYRDSKLTRILEESMGGSCRTFFFAMISPSAENFLESLSTLKFASRASYVTNSAKINEDLDEKALLRRYERELKLLRQQLASKSQLLVDKSRLIATEEKARQAEADKTRALQNLEQLTRDLIAEKQEKYELEKKINAMNSQLLTGGHHNAESAQNSADLHALYANYQYETQQLRLEYEQRMKELEKEALQSNKYKQLLLKQRDIMILLTNKLNERDNSLLSAQSIIQQQSQQLLGHEKQLDESRLGEIMQDKKINELEHQVSEQQELISVLQEQNNQLLAQAKQKISYNNNQNTALTQELSQVKGQLSAQRSERDALVTILEQKMKVLIDSVASSAHHELHNNSANVTITARAGKQLLVLQKLIEASLIAMKNAQNMENLNNVPGSSASSNNIPVLKISPEDGARSSNNPLTSPRKTVTFALDQGNANNNGAVLAAAAAPSVNLSASQRLSVSKPLSILSTPINFKSSLNLSNPGSNAKGNSILKRINVKSSSGTESIDELIAQREQELFNISQYKP